MREKGKRMTKEIHVFSGESLQAAIDSASEGDRIILHPGFYAERVRIERSVHLVGTSDSGPDEKCDKSRLGKVEWHNFPELKAELARPERLRDWLRLLWRGWRFHTVLGGRLYLIRRGCSNDPAN